MTVDRFRILFDPFQLLFRPDHRFAIEPCHRVDALLKFGDAPFGTQKARRLWYKAGQDGRKDADSASKTADEDCLARELPEKDSVEDVA